MPRQALSCTAVHCQALSCTCASCCAQAGSHAPLESIAAELDSIRARNEVQRARAENMAAERMAVEGRTKQAEARVAELEAVVEARLGSLPPGQRAAYQVAGWWLDVERGTKKGGSEGLLRARTLCACCMLACTYCM